MVRVRLMLRTGRKNWECQWNDPTTGKLRTKTTDTPRRRDAERLAGALEAEINSGLHDQATNPLWEVAADRYQDEVLSSRAAKTLHKFKATRNAVQEIISPKYVRGLTASQISKFQAGLREKGRAEATIKSHLSALRSFLNWAFRIGMLPKVPHINMPKRTAKMKHRPITAEEFERMLAATDTVAGATLAPEWKLFLRGLWYSGLRLDEALRLRWDNGDITVNLNGERPRLKIEANADKSTKARLLPIAPEFGEFLLSFDASRRHGRVFRPIVPGQILPDLRLDTCSKFITSIGKKAKVCVAERPPAEGKEEPRKSWAGAHCFRRAFGTRWSKRVRPQQLQELMRHEDIKTTLTFYVVDDIRETEDAAWQHATNISANSQEPIGDKTVTNTD